MNQLIQHIDPDINKLFYLRNNRIEKIINRPLLKDDLISMVSSSLRKKEKIFLLIVKKII